MTDTTQSTTPKSDPYRALVKDFDLESRSREQGSQGKLLQLLTMLSPEDSKSMLIGGDYVYNGAAYMGVGLLKKFLAYLDGEDTPETSEKYTDEYVAGAAHMLTAVMSGGALALEVLGRKDPQGVSITEALADIRKGASVEDSINRQMAKTEANG